MPDPLFHVANEAKSKNKILAFMSLFKKLPNILRKQMGVGRHRELDCLSGILGKPPARWQMDTSRKGELEPDLENKAIFCCTQSKNLEIC